jgi:hypothetical protein
MANTNFISAANLFGWGQSFNATGKFPIIAKRVWETYADMMEFVGDTSDVCPAGVVLTVINDTDSKKNGAYFVASCPTLDEPTLPVKVEKIGSGEVLSAANYAAAKALAKADMRGTLIYVSEDTEEGTKGFYIVAGDQEIQKLGTVSATDDISGDVASLKTDVNTLKGGVDVEGSVDNKIAAVFETINLEPYATTEYVDATFVKKEGYVEFTQAEKTKLEGIAEGAQVNVIEKVIFNGQEVVADGQTKTITLNTPADIVRGLADAEKFLSLDAATGKLGATVGLTYYTDTTGETPVYEIRLTGKGGEVISTIDAKSFVKDGMLDKVELAVNPANQATGTYLVFTWNTEAGVSEPMYVPVTDLVDVYSQGDGIEIDSNNVIKAKVKAEDPYLEVTTEGIASKGIDNAILVAKNAVIGTAEDAETAVTVYGVKKYAANLVGAHESAVTEVLKGKVDVAGYNEFVTNTNNTLSGIKVTDVDSTETAGVKLVKSETGVISVSVNSDTLVNNLVGATGAVGPVSGTTVKLGQAITDGAAENPTEIISATTSVHSAIQTLAGQIQAAVAGGITAIDGGEYITVGGTATSKTLAVNVAKIGTYLVDNSTALKVDADGKITLEWENVE